MTGIIFDIQRFSVHDGPGIRTTVFMKGCPLRCRWCHNPEGLSKNIQLRSFENKCIRCGSCGTREKIEDGEKCPVGALSVCGKEFDEDGLLAEILKDKPFYGNTGGVTFSGGECLLQADFVSAVMKRAKAEGLHTAVDTCGYVPWESIEKTLDHCDLYLYDIKCIDPNTHKEYTGVDNSLIIQNIKRLSDAKKDIWVRVPVIPGFNNTEEEMTKIAELVLTLPSVKQVTLMPYHSLGSDKYKTLGLEYKFDASLKIEDSELEGFKKIFESKNIKLA